MIRYSKKKIKKFKKIIQENAFVKKKKKPGLKFNPYYYYYYYYHYYY